MQESRGLLQRDHREDTSASESAGGQLSALHLPRQGRAAFFIFHANINLDRGLGTVPVESI